MALGWNFEHEPLSLPEHRAFIRSMVEPLCWFVSAVNWAVVSQIKFGADTGELAKGAKRRLTLTWIRNRKLGEAS